MTSATGIFVTGGEREHRLMTRYANRQDLAEAMAKSADRAVGRQIGRSLVRGVLGSLYPR